MGVTLLFLSGLCLGVPTANSRAMLLNTNLPETRGTAVAILVILSNLGKGCGPLIAAAMILSIGRTTAFLAITVIFSCASITYFLTALTYAGDIQKQVELVEQQVRIRGLTLQSVEMKELAQRLENSLNHDDEDDGGEGDGDGDDAGDGEDDAT